MKSFEIKIFAKLIFVIIAFCNIVALIIFYGSLQPLLLSIIWWVYFVCNTIFFILLYFNKKSGRNKLFIINWMSLAIYSFLIILNLEYFNFNVYYLTVIICLFLVLIGSNYLLLLRNKSLIHRYFYIFMGILSYVIGVFILFGLRLDLPVINNQFFIYYSLFNDFYHYFYPISIFVICYDVLSKFILLKKDN
jgi:hypothetical protein